MNFETYLISKKIDSAAFQQAEPEVWKAWCDEFEQMHPDSFTMQKLNLINPVRRKYTLTVVPQKKEEISNTETQRSSPLESDDTKPAEQPSKPKPSIPKPVFKPKPKMS